MEMYFISHGCIIKANVRQLKDQRGNTVYRQTDNGYNGRIFSARQCLGETLPERYKDAYNEQQAHADSVMAAWAEAKSNYGC